LNFDVILDGIREEEDVLRAPLGSKKGEPGQPRLPRQDRFSIYLDLGVVPIPMGPLSLTYDMLCILDVLSTTMSCKPSGVTIPVSAVRKVPIKANLEMIFMDVCTLNERLASVLSIMGHGDC
jgi:hypothetical protein